MRALNNPCKNCSKLTRNKQYCCVSCQQQHQTKIWIEKWLSGEISGYYGTNLWGGIPDRIRNYLFKKYNNSCAICGWNTVNNFTGKIPLEVEHIDGKYKNNRPENLTLLCPNCHSLTATYRGANKGNGRKKTWELIRE